MSFNCVDTCTEGREVREMGEFRGGQYGTQRRSTKKHAPSIGGRAVRELDLVPIGAVRVSWGGSGNYGGNHVLLTLICWTAVNKGDVRLAHGECEVREQGVKRQRE
jgi:hypothetical protein